VKDDPISSFDFKVCNAIQNPDGSVSYEFEYSDEFKDFYEEKTGKELTEEGFQEFVDEVISKNLEGEEKKSIDSSESEE
tara:strand:- start:1576 stop:1812 length:237 start_codon:yes stop_codon:yes gene_type:complete